MQVALDKNQKRRRAFETERDDGPFTCPSCDAEVIIKKGEIREHHYAHKPPFDCKYGSKESELHYKAKRELFEAFNKHKKCSKCELERPLGTVRPDVSLYIGNYPVAIEIQRSDITIDDIVRRTKAYCEKNIYLLWLLPETGPKFTEDEYGQKTTRIKEWQKFLQAMYFGRIYYWTQEGLLVQPTRLDTYTKEVESGNWVEDYEDEVGDDLSGTDWYAENHDYADYGGHTKFYKSTKLVIPSSTGPLNLVEDFQPTQKRKPFSTTNWTVPQCLIWMDKLKKWW